MFTVRLRLTLPIRILGISAYYHDSAAVLVEDGRIVAAAQEERFTRKKHDPAFPSRAVEYCLREAGILAGELDHVAFYEKPLVKFERLLTTYIACAPRGLQSYMMAMPLWLGEKLWMGDHLRDEIPGYEGELLFGEHHESHAASAFYPSPFEEAAIVTIDGVGEWATSSIGVGRGNEIELMVEQRFPHSLGLLYSAFTYFTGFKVNSGEYKVMGLAPYGRPKYVKAIKDHLVEIRDDGSVWMNMEYFTYPHGLTMTGPAFERLFDGPARRPESKLTQREMDLARSVQDITEEVMIKMARYARQKTGLGNLCLAGGVALNCVGNGRILREEIVRRALDSAGRRRRRRRARRRAERVAPFPPAAPIEPGTGRNVGAAQVLEHPDSAICRRDERLVSRSPLQRGRDPAVRRRAGPHRGARHPRGPCGAGCRAPRRREGGRPLSGTDGVRPSRAGRAIDHRRRAVAEDAVGDEPEDQVPRVVPAVRSRRAARARRRLVRARRRQPVHAARRRRPPRPPPAAPGRGGGTLGHRAAEHRPIDHPGRHPRRLLGAHSDRSARDQPAVLRHPRSRSTPGPAVR